MKTYLKLFSLALCACALGACSEDEPGGTGSGGSSDKQYVVMSGSGENNGYVSNFIM